MSQPTEPTTGAIDEQRAAEMIGKLKEGRDRILSQLRRVIIGQQEVVDQVMLSFFAGGHCLITGVPGLAKTLLIKSMGDTLDLTFRRIQFTPDLMPSDITGTEILQDDPETRQRIFKFLPGPVFCNIILADEINRTPPKTQAALLEAMQEKSVSIGGETHALELPFFVLATQNPLEQEGTYPLPEAQLDRFIFKIFVDYPDDGEELEIMRRVSSPEFAAREGQMKTVLDGEQILKLQEVVLRVPVADHVLHYAKKLVRSTRPETPEALDFVKEWLSWGAGPRASFYLIIAGKARAILHGNYHVSCEDIDAMALPVMRHRIVCNYTAQAEGITSDAVIKKLLETIPKDEKLT